MTRIKVNPGVQIQRGSITYTAGEIVKVSAKEAEAYVKGGEASYVDKQ